MRPCLNVFIEMLHEQRVELYNPYPKKVKSFTEFQELPILTRTTVANNYKAFLNPKMPNVTGRRTSGSTGSPMMVYTSEETQLSKYRCAAQCRAWHKVHPLAKAVIIRMPEDIPAQSSPNVCYIDCTWSVFAQLGGAKCINVGDGSTP